ncbi:sulfite exporter TauE/SafE family protein [Nakamurella flavida]|uniref:Probable membrane transporter protein n=1 Tax=Nakamurella flavida TaxID=363630 RepID=A0A938YL01_9ACTN|nr:sulfite exporter TauE/SafE family protein [Nakamurella flavida]MBM9475204.1 sulfite exporter TauE/SafE family protein [Nakamurella flavida]MDP9776777.1 putative membrane protein YfcA [Nakamurella flavida]
MTGWDAVLLVGAGVAGGLTGSIAGLASLFTYPALLLTGLTPVAANISNTVALLFGGFGSAASSRPELTGQARPLRIWGLLAAVGGMSGAALLLLTPADNFARIVPFLVGLAALTILIPRRRRPAAGGVPAMLSGRVRPVVAIGVFAVAVYGGYFGAAAGVLMLALLLFAGGDTLPRANAAKNILMLTANGVAAVGFVIFADVPWSHVLPLAAGAVVGSWLGPKVVRRAPATVLRAIIGIAGLGLAIRLGIQAYG